MMQPSPDDDALFDTKVDSWMSSALGQGVSSFSELVDRLPGVYPGVAISSLERLLRNNRVDAPSASKLLSEGRTIQPCSVSGRPLLPIPHPLDFEWRFTPATSKDLIDLSATFAPKDSNILLFGTPGLAAESLSQPLSRAVSFLGEDNAVTRRVASLNAAIGSPISVSFCNAGLPVETASLVILDPPWYLDFIRPMLSAAAAACCISGFVFISLPPAGARPSAGEDRDTVVRFAHRLGLDLAEVHPLSIRYDTPLFERNALLACGLCAPAQWRRGDLVVFRKTRGTARPISARSTQQRRWIDVSIGRMRLFVRCGLPAPSGMQGLLPVVEGDILPSVSRRDPRRVQAQIWTSGNRIFATDNPDLVLEAAFAYDCERRATGAQSGLWDTAAKREAIEKVGQQLAQLAAREAAEEGGLQQEMAWDERVSWNSRSTNYLDQFRATGSG